MGIKISAVFLMTILIAGFSSFPSSISNSSTEFIDQTNSPSLINMAFAASDKEDKAAAKADKAADKAAAKADKAADKAAYKADKAADKAAAKADKAADKAAAKADKAAAKAEKKIQEFNGGAVTYTSNTTICHIPGTPAEKTKVLPESALKGHLGHGDLLGVCAENSLEDILPKKTKKPKTCFLFWCW